MQQITREECERIDKQRWGERLGVAPYVRVGRGWVLNKRDDGACVFLDEDNRCKIHTEYGEAAKPLACRAFPFSVRPVRGGWQASLRFDCPSVISSKGRPVRQHKVWLTELFQGLDHKPPRDEDSPHLQRGVRATADEVDTIVSRFVRWLQHNDLSRAQRLVGAARVTTILEDAKFKKVRGPRFAELLDLLFGALPSEGTTAPAPPTARQRGMLRQLAFAHAEHVTLSERRKGRLAQFRRRWRQLRDARLFLRGAGRVPALPGIAGDATFERLEAAGPVTDRVSDAENLIIRYLAGRLEGRSVFGDGYYGWPVVAGLGALWLSIAVAGWLARYSAAAGGRSTTSFDDVARSLAIVDRASSRLPALGSMAERARVTFLFADDGIARLVNEYSLMGEDQ